MDDRINNVAFFITLAAPTLGFLLLVAQDILKAPDRSTKDSKFIEIIYSSILLLSIVCVISYVLYEFSIPPEYNIRVDLFLAYPALLVAFINGGIVIFIMKPNVD